MAINVRDLYAWPSVDNQYDDDDGDDDDNDDNNDGNNVDDDDDDEYDNDYLRKVFQDCVHQVNYCWHDH